MKFDLQPTLIGSLVSLRPLGRGAYGEVNLARDSGNGGRLVAIKQLNKRVLRRKRVGRTGNALELVQKEVEVWRKLNHKHTVALLEVKGFRLSPAPFP